MTLDIMADLTMLRLVNTGLERVMVKGYICSVAFETAKLSLPIFPEIRHPKGEPARLCSFQRLLGALPLVSQSSGGP